MSSFANFDSKLIAAKATAGIFDTFLQCFYIVAVVYGFTRFLTDVLCLGFTISLIIVGVLSLIVNYFKIPRAPLENSSAVFGADSTLPTQTNQSRKKSKAKTKSVRTDEEKGISSTEMDDLDEGEDCEENDPESGSTVPNGSNGVITKRRSVSLLQNLFKVDDVLPTEGSHQYTIPITIVGHRGAGLDAPENTLTAFRQCKSRGCNFIEFDVSLTKDNVPVIFHDDDLIRVAGLDMKISDMTWEELKKVDLSVNHPLREKYVGERIPSFDEALKLLIELEMKFFIDLKDTNQLIVNTICEAFIRYPQMYKLAVVSSFYARVIYEIRRRDPNILGCMAWRPQFEQYKGWTVDGSILEPRYPFILQDFGASLWDHVHTWLVSTFYWWFLGLSAILLQKDSVSKNELLHWSKKNVRVFLWTVNAPVEKLFFSQTVRVSYLTDTLDGDILKVK